MFAYVDVMERSSEITQQFCVRLTTATRETVMTVIYDVIRGCRNPHHFYLKPTRELLCFENEFHRVTVCFIEDAEPDASDKPIYLTDLIDFLCS